MIFAQNAQHAALDGHLRGGNIDGFHVTKALKNQWVTDSKRFRHWVGLMKLLKRRIGSAILQQNAWASRAGVQSRAG
jgi:hypothetical protein